MADHGYTEPTPIQVQAIPVILAGRDLLGAAQTGTGKTAGFTLPLLQRLAEAGEGANGRAPRALILVPTRELAAQVHESVRTYGAHLTLRSAVIFGGVGAQPQIDALRRGLDILVATPGRLLDLLQQKAVSLGSIQFLVLDEADRMLDMGFIHDIRKVLAVLPAVRQNLLFSATFSDDIRRLAGTFLKNPATVEVARRNTPAELVAQVVHPVEPRAKRDLLAHLVKTNDWKQVLVFVRTKHGANRLAEQLERAGVEASAIHGNKSQNARTRALKRFKDGDLRVLVATDIAARGLDIEALPHVVNFDIPHVAEDYVHRIGRTGRAGTEGEAVSLVSQEEGGLFAAIERLIGQKITRRVIEGFEGASAPVPGAVAARHTDEIDADRPPMESRERSGRGHRPPSRGAQPGRNASGGRGRRGGGGGGGRGQRPQGAPRQDGGPRGEADGNRAAGAPRSAPRTSRPQAAARPAWRGARGRGSAPIDADERTRQLNDFRARARQDPGEHRLPPLPREDPAAKPEKVKREPTIVRRVASRLSSLLAGAPRPVPEREEK